MIDVGSTEVDMPPAAPAAPAATTRRRRTVLIIAGAAALLAGLVATVSVTHRYRDAPPLTSAGSYSWAAPDIARTRYDRIDRFPRLAVTIRPGRPQSFYVQVVNPSSVTQTVLGLPAQDGVTAVQDRLAVSAGDDRGTVLTEADLVYLAGPTAIPPHALRFLRYTVTVPRCSPPGRVLFWDSLRVRVRVGTFTRTETVSFDDVGFELDGPRTNC